MITGTVRMNLDPTKQDDNDDELWRALNTAQLEKHIQDLGGLDVFLHRDDKRLDNRQKRLFCLARVLLEDRQASCLSFSAGSFLLCRFLLSMKEKAMKTPKLSMRSTKLCESISKTRRSSP